MFHILAWRWPFLALFLATVFYVGRYYTIAGIEHLHLKPRETVVASAESEPTDQESDSLWNWDPVQSNLPEGFLNNPLASSRPSEKSREWRDKLSLGEKLAMWQDKFADEPLVSPESNSIPLSSPIPAPSDIGPSSFMSGAARSTLAPESRNLVVPPQGGQSPQSPPRQTSQPGLGTMTSLPTSRSAREGADPLGLGRNPQSIRIGSFNTGMLSPAKLAKPHAMAALVGMLRQFDLVALQGIQSSRDDLLPTLVDKLNESGRKYDYLIGPRVGRVAPKIQFAMVFDTDRLETDRYQLYTVDDPEDLLQYEPLVGWFRCRGVPNQAAFTFSLVNLYLDPNLAQSEQKVIPGLVEAVLKDGRGEDDWIIAGHIASGASQLLQPAGSSVRFAIRDMPTNVAGTHQLDSIFFSALATTEYTGRSGALDFLRQYNLSIEHALEISAHLPIWAEFSVVEGAEPGRVAPANPQQVF